jgi:hypothetical protein
MLKQIVLAVAFALSTFVVMIGVQAQQVPNPTTATEVLGLAPGTAMTKPYVETVARSWRNSE